MYKHLSIVFFCLITGSLFARELQPDILGSTKDKVRKVETHDIFISFISPDIRFKKNDVPDIQVVQSWDTKAWKGEKVHSQILIRSIKNLKNVSFETGNLTDNKNRIISSNYVKADFVRFVVTDGLNKEGGGCGIMAGHDSLLVADIIDTVKMLDISSNIIQPAWLTIIVPTETPQGIYRGVLKIYEGKKKIQELKYSVQVLNHILPPPHNWKFHLDLWQNPFAVARVNNLEPWSKEHMEIMRPLMQRLADAGQKSITASIINDPWNGQTFDIYHSMIQWIKKKNGNWEYNYTIFDQWVSFMMDLGIDKYINCYSMIPWNLKFSYFDESAGKQTSMIASPGTDAYSAIWVPMLKDFAQHLKAKKWFSKTTIAMDERQMEDMKKAIAVIKSADSDFKISLAGNYHPEIESELIDYSLASNQLIDNNVLSSRRQKGYITTYYTCCTEGNPNTFTFSPPAESAWLSWFAANKGFDGYLRWAYNCWNKDPLTDSRFGTWSAGDAFMVYPGNRSSIRFERLVEGIQDYEKIKILQQEFKNTHQQEKLTGLLSILKHFEINELKYRPASEMINSAKKILNAF